MPQLEGRGFTFREQYGPDLDVGSYGVGVAGNQWPDSLGNWEVIVALRLASPGPATRERIEASIGS